MMFNKIVRNLGRFIVLGAVVVAPWRNGAFEPLYLRVLMFMTISAAVLALAALWSTPERKRKVNSYWPAIFLSIPTLLGLALGVLQVLPLSDASIARFSPHIAELRRLFVPIETELTFAEFNAADSDAIVAAEEAQIRDLADLAREKNSEFFPYDEAEASTVERAMLLDSIIDKELLPDDQRDNLHHWGNTLSVNPLMTKQLLPTFWTALTLFLAASILFNSSESRRVLFKTVVFTGLAVAAFSLALKANPSLINYEDYDYWWLIGVTTSYGPYVNKNACGGYLVLGFGACLYFVAREFLTSARTMRKELHERRLEEEERQKETVYHRSGEARWKVVLGDVFELFNRRLFFWLCVLGFFYASILASLSRGAAVAATVAMATSIVFMFFRRETWRFWYVPFVAFLIAFVALVAVSRFESVDARMTTLVEEDADGETAFGRDTRWENWADALKSSRDYPWLGAGLGTYRLANFANDRVTKYDRLFFYAENSFVQTLLELGRVGLILLVSEYLLLLGLIGVFLKGRHSVETTAFGISGVAIVLGQVISSSVDFGIYLPANLFLFAVLCGACVGRQKKRQFDELVKASARKETAEAAVSQMRLLSRRERCGLFVFSALLLLILSGGVAALRENSDHIVRRDLLRAAENLTEEKLITMSSTAIDGLIRDLREYVSKRDDSYEVRYALANLGLIRFRLRYADYLKKCRPDDSPEALWNESLPEYYLKTFLEYQWSGLKIPVESTRNNEFICDTLPDVAADLLAARRICPLYSSAYLTLLGVFPLCLETSWEDERGLANLYARRIVSLGPYDSQNLIMSGYRLGRFKLWGLEKKFLNQAVANYGLCAPQILEILNDTIPAALLPGAVDETLTDDPKTLTRACNVLQKSKETALFRALEAKARKCFTEAPEEARDSRFYYWAGFFYNIMGEYDTAQEQLAKSYELDEDNDQAFFLRAGILCDRSSILLKDEECVRILTEYCEKSHGQRLWMAEELLKKAQSNLLENTARLDARERIRKEREEDERIKNEVRARLAAEKEEARGAEESADSEMMEDLE